MSLTSIFFLFFFLPLSLAVYHASGHKAQEYVMLVLNVLFYSLCSIKYTVFFIGEVAITVFIGRSMHHSDSHNTKKILLISGIVFNLGLLIYYKYSNFLLSIWVQITSNTLTIKELALPLGISFFSFKAISYMVDIYRGEAKLISNPIHDALYLSFFPQIISGPLSRYNDSVRQSNQTLSLFSDGVVRFLIGFSKKILLSNMLSRIVTEVFNASIQDTSTFYLWFGSICYSLQLLFDFSGYSDMSIGISEMFGYRCPENFNYPYLTDSVSHFWRRWHISLGAWFRDYVYIPLGGSRSSTSIRNFFNLFVVWILTGIWHGSSWKFIVWGIIYFIAISFERLTGLPEHIKSTFGKTLYRIIVLLFINFQWVLFRANNFSAGLSYIQSMILYRANALADFRTLFLLKNYWLFILLSIILCFPIIPWINKKLENSRLAHIIYQIIFSLVIIGAFIWSVSFVIAGMHNPFVYANF